MAVRLRGDLAPVRRVVCPKRPGPSISYQGEPQSAESTSEFMALCDASHREALRSRDDAREVEVPL